MLTGEEIMAGPWSKKNILNISPISPDLRAATLKGFHITSGTSENLMNLVQFA